MELADDSTTGKPKPMPEPKPKRKRSPFQFGIRFLLILSTVAAFAIAYVSFRLRTERLQRETLEAFPGAKTQALYDYQVYDPETGKIPGVPPGPQFLKDWFGKHILANIVQFRVIGEARSSDSIDLSPLANLKHLRHLRFEHLDGFKDLKSMQYAPHLVRLRIEYCSSLKSLTGIEHCTGLEQIEIINSGRLEDIAAIKSLTNLKQIFISQRRLPTERDDDPLDDASYLKSMQQLEDLHISVPHWKTLNGFEGLAQLKDLTLTEANDLEDATGMKSLPRLKILKLLGASSLKQLVIPESADLEQVYISGATNLERIVLAGDQSAIVSLTVLDCPNLEGLDELEDCPNLRHVRISKVQRLIDAAAEVPFENRGIRFEYDEPLSD